MARSFAVVCEAPADRETACDLADRVFREAADWVEENLGHLREWRGLHANQTHLEWKEVPKLARENNLRAHGHFNGEPGAPDAHAARLALFLFIKLSDRPPDGVILVRDADDQLTRRKGLEQARDCTPLGVPVVIGLAYTKRECWVLAGFNPCTEEEEARLAQVHQELGFDPRIHHDRLTAKRDHEPRSAKRILSLLCVLRTREEDCWKTCSLDVLRERGRDNGLAAYLREVEQRLRPLLAAP